MGNVLLMVALCPPATWLRYWVDTGSSLAEPDERSLVEDGLSASTPILLRCAAARSLASSETLGLCRVALNPPATRFAILQRGEVSEEHGAKKEARYHLAAQTS